MLRIHRIAAAAVFLAVSLSSWASPRVWAENWPRFRGPSGQGVSTETGLPVAWSTTENVAWKTAIPGEGWSSPIIWGDRVFLTTAVDEGRSCHVICLDRKTGSIAWDREVFQQTPPSKRPDNSHATPTPVTDGKDVYAVFSSGGVAAVDMDGKLAWENHDVKFFSQHGLGASPILHEGLVIMPFDGSSDGADYQIGFKKGWDGAVILALDKATGKVRWRAKRGLSRLAHVTPQIRREGDSFQLLSAAGDVVQAHDPASGELVWTVHSQGEGVTPSIVLGPDMLYSCSGFDKPTIRAIRYGGSGDVTATHIAWEQTKGVPAMSSLLYAEPYVYSVTDNGVAHCFDAATGDQKWVHRIDGRHSASPIWAEGKIYFHSEEGDTVVIEAGPVYREVGRNSLGELCRASIAASHGNLFIRTASQLYCIGAAPE